MRGSVPTLRPEEVATARLYGDLWVLAAARLHLLTLDLLERRPFDLPGLRREVDELRQIALGCRHSPGPVPGWRKRR